MARAVPQSILAAFDQEDNPLDLVVTLDTEGQQRRFASQPYTVPGAERDVEVDGGLLEEVQVPAGSASVRDGSMNISGDTSVRLSVEAASWLLSLSANAPMQKVRVEIAAVNAATGPWEERLVLHEGVLRSPSWDLRGGWVSFRVSQVAPDGRGMAPPNVVPAALPTGGTPERSRGIPMPLLYGETIYQVAAPALFEAADANLILVAGHHVRSAAVAVHREDSGGLASDVSKTPTNALAGFGVQYSYVTLTDAEYWQDTPTNTKPYVFSVDAFGKLGSAPSGGGTAELRLLGEVLLDLVTGYAQMSLDRVDVGSFRALDATLQIPVSVQVTDQDSAVGWAQKIVQDLPVRLEWVGGRLTLLPCALRSDSRQAVAAELRWDYELVDLVSPYEQDSVDGVANDVLVRYAFRNRTRTFTKAIALNPDTDGVCAASAGRHGRRSLPQPIDLWQVEADDGAFLVAHEAVARLAHARARCAYLADTRSVLHLRELDLVNVTDAGQGVVRQAFFVEQVVPGETHSVLRLASRAEMEVTWGEFS